MIHGDLLFEVLFVLIGACLSIALISNVFHTATSHLGRYVKKPPPSFSFEDLQKNESPLKFFRPRILSSIVLCTRNRGYFIFRVTADTKVGHVILRHLVWTVKHKSIKDFEVGVTLVSFVTSCDKSKISMISRNFLAEKSGRSES